MSQQRQFERIALDVWIEERASEGTYYHLAKNISRGGLFVAKRLPRPAGTQMDLTINLPQNPLPIHTQAEVVYVRSDKDAPTAQRPAGMGLKFVGLAPSASEILTRFIEKNRN